MKLIDLFIDPEDKDSGVTGIATVDFPAIEQGYFAFKNQLSKRRITLGSVKGNFNPVQGDKQILAGPLMIPEMPIYRIDESEEYNVRFRKETIEQIVKKFSRLGLANNINEMHDSAKMIEGSYLYQSFIINRAMGINPPLGQEQLPDGTWFGFVYVGDKKVWDDFIKTGIYTGFSVEGNFYEQEVLPEVPEIDEALASAIEAALA